MTIIENARAKFTDFGGEAARWIVNTRKGDSGDDGCDSFEIAGLFLSPLHVQVVTVVTRSVTKASSGSRRAHWPDNIAIRQSQDRRVAETGERAVNHKWAVRIIRRNDKDPSA